jgi:hypothetical protein
MDRGCGDELLCQCTGRCLLRYAGAVRGRAPRVGAATRSLRRPKLELAAAEVELACGEVPSSPRSGEDCGSPGGARRQPGVEHPACGRGKELAGAMGRARADLASGQELSSPRPGRSSSRGTLGTARRRVPSSPILLRAAPSPAAAPLLLAPAPRALSSKSVARPSSSAHPTRLSLRRHGSHRRQRELLGGGKRGHTHPASLFPFVCIQCHKRVFHMF